MIACCIISAGRAPQLERAIGSVRPHVDQCFVYLTRADDEETVEVCERLGVVVERGEWKDDYAWARNRSFDMPAPEFTWLLWVDDDDVLVGQPDALRAVVGDADSRGHDAYAMWWVESNGSSLPITRLLRRSVGWTWRNPVHEQLVQEQGIGERLAFIHPQMAQLEHMKPWVHRSFGRYARSSARSGWSTSPTQERSRRRTCC